MVINAVYLKEDLTPVQILQSENPAFSHDIREYVAELQFHMTLQARNLVPTLDHPTDSRVKLLHETQATLEKMASRHRI